MKRNRIVALGCFTAAGALYYYGSGAHGVAAVLVGLGMCFELVGWKNFFKRDSK